MSIFSWLKKQFSIKSDVGRRVFLGGVIALPFLKIPPAAATVVAPTLPINSVLLNLVRRNLPNVIAYDICGVQPISGPDGILFKMRAREADHPNFPNYNTWSDPIV